jgi:hypothetical protein
MQAVITNTVTCYSATMELNDTSALSAVCETVQHNCAISDARFARDYSLCIYLLRMREFYRWKEQIPPGDSIDTEALGAWVSDTEMHWDEIEETDFLPLPLNGKSIEPFDTMAVNDALQQTGLVYSAGIGRFGQPHFVLAKLRQQTRHDDIVCIECGDELARDTITMPAMTQGSTVFIRHHSIAQMLWQMLDEWRIKKLPGPMSRVVTHFDINFDAPLDPQIARVAEALAPLLLQHEFGEQAVSERLGKDFSAVIQAFLGRRGEMALRAVRDLLADSIKTWPFILQDNTTDSSAPSAVYLDFWLASLNGYREVLLKQSPQAQAFLSQAEGLTASGRQAALKRLIEPEQERWQQVATALIADFNTHGDALDVEATINTCAGNWS